MYVIHIIIFACSHVYILIYTYSFIYKHVVSETLPNSLQSLTFGYAFNQSMVGVTLPNSLRNLTFGARFNQCMDGVKLPNCLETLTFGDLFKQSLEHVTLPSSLQSLTIFRKQYTYADNGSFGRAQVIPFALRLSLG